MGRYVMDVFWRKPGPLDSRQLGAKDDPAAIMEADKIFAGLSADPGIIGYRVRNPAPGSDRIFHERSKEILPNATPSARREVSR